jgi:hypothetical protein
VRVIAETHPLFGRLLVARSFKRWNGVLLLVVDLPDGSPGTIRADATRILDKPLRYVQHHGENRHHLWNSVNAAAGNDVNVDTRPTVVC